MGEVSDWIEPMKDKVRPLLEAAAKDYVVQGPGLAEAHRGLRQVVVTSVSRAQRSMK